MIAIPSIDILDNKIVRLKKGDFNQVTFYENSPPEQAKIYESFGFKLIHIVDLEGSRSGNFMAVDSIKKIKKETELKIQFGGGIRNSDNVKELFDAGIDFIVIGSLSVKNKTEFEKIIDDFSPGKIIVAADVDKEMIKISGWTEETDLSVYLHIDYCKNLGIKKFLVTDISKDGMLSGTNISLYKKLMKKNPGINLISSGGIKDIEDVKNLDKINPYAVVVGKAIYENKIDLKELSQFAL